MNTNAIVALLGALVVPFIGGIIGLVLGARARREIADSGGQQSGDILAVAAMIVGGLHLVFFAMVFFSVCGAAALNFGS